MLKTLLPHRPPMTGGSGDSKIATVSATETPQLLDRSPHTCPTPFSQTLIDAFTATDLTPPFSLQVPTPSDYAALTHALVCAALTSLPHLSRVHITHLHATVTDGYRLFTVALLNVSHLLFPSLLPRPRSQLLWILPHLIRVEAVGLQDLILTLLRRACGGDFSEPNLQFCSGLLRVLTDEWDWVSEEPLVLSSAVFVYLRLLADHYRLADFDELKRLEVEFCVRALRERFEFCLKVGRDLVRLLQDVAFVPELREVWKDLIFKPQAFKVPTFTDLVQIYRIPTPAHYFLLRTTPEMEKQMRFLLTHVRWGSQRRYQEWFGRKFLCRPEQETLVADLVRFICCAHHPSNEILQSEVIPRWAVVGWLLSCCRRNYLEANVKLALFYDWLFFDEATDNIMNVEPAILLMVHSLPKYAQLSNCLLEFLFLLVENYDMDMKGEISRGVAEAFGAVARKGVVTSLEPLMYSAVISPALKEKLTSFISVKRSRNVEEPAELGKSKHVKGHYELSGTRHGVRATSEISGTRRCQETSALIK